MSKRIIVVLALAVGAIGCHRDKLPEGILSQEQMVDFLTAAYMLEANYAIESGYSYDSIPSGAIAAYNQVLSDCGLDRETVQKSITYYSEHPDLYSRMHNEVLERIKQPE